MLLFYCREVFNMAYIYDKKSHWHACKREVLDNRLKKIVDDDYLSALYLLGDDYAIVVIMPLDIVPEYIFNQIEEDL